MTEKYQLSRKAERDFIMHTDFREIVKDLGNMVVGQECFITKNNQGRGRVEFYRDALKEAFGDEAGKYEIIITSDEDNSKINTLRVKRVR
ncbi:MAG TPA: hypothetical protein VJZ93_01135 [Candidatus Nanoarchaeia archaeon]|nr:hypothetical protein [Candidatus Nanoarchaeia archaeon]